MKLRVAFVLAVVLLGVLPLTAAPVAVRAAIPFEFRAGDTVLPAGDYRIKYITPNTVLIEARSGEALTLVPVASKGVEGQAAKLVFHRYGNTYFLRQLQIPGRTTGHFFKSKSEKETALAYAAPVSATEVPVVMNR